MGITNAFTPLGKTISYATTASLPLYLATALTAQAATINVTEAINDNVLMTNDPSLLAFSITGEQENTFSLSGLTFDSAAMGLTGTKPVWEELTEGTLFTDRFADEIAAIRESAAERQQRIRATIDITEQETGKLVYATIAPVGVTSDQAPMTFTHISGPIGITDEVVNGEAKRYVGAYIGIDTDALIMEQVTQDPRGIHKIGELVTTAAPDIKVSENARVAAMFTQEKGGIEELQISVGYDMLENEDIALTLFDANGDVAKTIDANEFQIKETPDFLVMVIKDDPETLAAIYDNMLADGGFSIEARSPMGRKVLSEFDFGPDFEQKLDQGYAQIDNPGYHFDATQDFKRRVAYDPSAPAVDHDVQKCVFLGLQNLSEDKLDDIRVVLGEVTDGTSMPTRDFTALVAIDQFNNVVAAGSQAWWGVNYETNTVRRSGSSDTRFLTNGGNVFSGCTDDKITTIVPPKLPDSPHGYIPGIPGLPGTPGTPDIPYYGGYFPPGGGIFVPPGGGYTPPTIPETPATVDGPPSWTLLPTGLAALALMRSLANGKGGGNPTSTTGQQIVGRREDEYETPAANAA